MPRRHTWRWFDYIGVAAQHHDRYRHNVHVDVAGGVSYLTDEENARRRKERE